MDKAFCILGGLVVGFCIACGGVSDLKESYVKSGVMTFQDAAYKVSRAVEIR